MRKLLIIDDSPLVRNQIAQMISIIADIDLVAQTGTVSESLVAIRTLSPDIIILDLHLPDGDGFEILNVVKTFYPGTRVIVLTNYPFPQHRTKALEVGAEYFFDKSLEFEKVVDVLKGSTIRELEK